MGAEGLVELDAGCLVDEIGLDGLVPSESIGNSRKSVFDLAGNDGDDRVGSIGIAWSGSPEASSARRSMES